MSNTWLSSLVSKHSTSGIVLDSNLLFVYCIGLLDPNLVGSEKRTREYTPTDFRLIDQFLGKFVRIITTPNILTEVSNLANQLRDSIRLLHRQMIRDKLLAVFEERYIATTIASQHSVYDRLGVTDAAIAVLAAEGCLVLTNDLDLSLMLEHRRTDCVRYDRHLRPLVLMSE